jgi:SAM-dependent methyltransferase
MFSAAESYESYMGRWSRLLAPKFIAFTGVAEGDRVLDVGTGTGSLASSLGEALRSVDVVAIDPSEGFIGFAQKSSKSARIQFERGDAQALRFPDASFDAAMALLVLNFIPDERKALAEMRRVTRPQGRIGACVWDYGAGMQSLRIFWDEVVAMDPAMAPKDERHMKLSREGELAALWKSAGLVEVEEKPLTIEQAFASFDDYWGPFLKGAGPGGAYVASLPEALRAELGARLKRRVLGHRKDGPFVLSASAWSVKGRAP